MHNYRFTSLLGEHLRGAEINPLHPRVPNLDKNSRNSSGPSKYECVFQILARFTLR